MMQIFSLTIFHNNHNLLLNHKLRKKCKCLKINNNNPYILIRQKFNIALLNNLQYRRFQKKK